MRSINQKLHTRKKLLLGAVPFIVLALTYAIASHLRRLDNPSDKLLPSFEAIASGFWRMAFEADRRSGDYLFWIDTLDSLWRLGMGMSISLVLCLTLGIAIGLIPYIRGMFNPFVAAVSLIPPITVLPILFIVFGLGEVSKIMLIVVGTAPVLIRSTAQSVMDIPREMIIKAETLGASVRQLIIRVILPQIMPRVINTFRLSLVPAWIFLISAEAIASTSGLGYRIFLVRRYLAMDVIIPYVLWITLLAFIIDRILLMISAKCFPWYLAGKEGL